MEDFYLFLSSADCVDEYPANSANSFSIQFPQEIVLETPKLGHYMWQVAITDFCVDNSPKTWEESTKVIVLLCDLVTGSYFRQAQYQILRIIASHNVLQSGLFGVQYMPLQKYNFRTLKLELRDQDLSLYHLEKDVVLSVTLHFQLVEKLIQN